MDMDVKLFDVTANNTYEGRLTKGKKYRICRVIFPKSYPEGLFLIHCDNGKYEIFTADFFEPVND